MSGRIQSRLAIFAALAAMVAIMIPSTLALGDEEPIVAGDASVVLLTTGAVDNITWEGSATPQSLLLRKNCTVAVGTNPQFLDITAIGGELGNDKDGLGVRSAGDGRGEPCGRTEASDGEAISVALGSSLSGHLMSAIDFDVELKFNAAISASYRRNGTQVASHTFNPTTGSDDGPDSRDGDNYRYYHRPMTAATETTPAAPIYFDQVILTPTSGSFSLEGGADLGSVADCEDQPPDNLYPCGQIDPVPNTSSQIEVVEVFDGVITCGDSLTIMNDGETLVGELFVHSMQVTSGGSWSTTEPPCQLKPYNASANDDTIVFVPELEGTSARYTLEVTLTGQTITVDSQGRITSLIAVYDPEGDTDPTIPVPACLEQPVTDQSDSGYLAYWTSSSINLLPSGHFVCWYQSSVSSTGTSVGTEVWGFYFGGDPGIGFR